MNKDEFIPIPTDADHVTIRQEPTTKVQKADLWLQDTKYFLLKYKWLIVLGVFLMFLIPLTIVFIFYLSSTETAKEATLAFFTAIGIFFKNFFLIVFGNIATLVLAFVATYFLGKRLMHRQKILFEEFNGEKMPVLTMRKTQDEIVIYKDRSNFLTTLIRGKIKIHIDVETFNIFEDIGEKKILTIDNVDLEVLRVYVLPEAEMKGEKMFLTNDEGKVVFNTLYLMDKHDVEEYVMKIQLPGVNAEKLRRTLVNLTLKDNKNRQSIARLEKESDEKLEREFWDYLARQTPKDSYGKQIIRDLWRKDKETDGKPDEIVSRAYTKHLRRNYPDEQISQEEFNYE